MDVQRDIALFHYRERLHLSYQQAMDEPNEEIERAFTIWNLEAYRDKLKAVGNSA